MARKTKEQKEIECLEKRLDEMGYMLRRLRQVTEEDKSEAFGKRVVDGVVAELISLSERLHNETQERGRKLIIMGYPKEKLPSSLKVCFCIAEHLMKIAEQQAGHPLSIPVE